jgi:hypothetical protein
MQSLLRSTTKTPPQHQLEEIRQALKVHYGLYQQERDAEGMALYRPLLQAANQAQSVEELKNLLR